MDKPLVQCVVVLYKQHPGQARCLSSLVEICEQDWSIASKINIFVQDNSPETQMPAFTSVGVDSEYCHDPTNPGLAAAYNKALAAAARRECRWLLLLDQDTVLNQNFLLQLLAAVQSETSNHACAFVPRLIRAGHVVSPHIVRKRSYDPLPVGFYGFASEPLLPCNSGSCLSVQALLSIGGFPEEYWLDFLDYIIFHRLHAAGGRVCVIDAQLEHSLSLHNMEAEVSVERHANMLAAEWQFIRETKPMSDQMIHRLSLLKRALRQAVKLRSKAYALETLQAALK